MNPEKLIGNTILLKNTRYRITDVYHGESGPMVYAEQIDPVKGPSRAAFHLDDIRDLITEHAEAS